MPVVNEKAQTSVTPQWVVVGNMSDRVRGGRIEGQDHTGTRFFSPGSRLYVGYGYWDRGETIHVIGLRRISRDWVNCIVAVDLLVDVRPNLVYSGELIDRLQRLECNFFENREFAELEVSLIAEWAKMNLERKSRNTAMLDADPRP